MDPERRSRFLRHVGVEVRCGRIELPAGGACFVEIADGQHDFDVRGQEARPLQAIARRSDHAADRAGRGVSITLREAQECQSGLRFGSEAAGVAVGGFGILEFAAQAMDFCLLVVRAAGRLSFGRTHAALHRATSFHDGLCPRAAHLHDFGAMDQAMSGEHAELGMRFAPNGQRCRPFADAIERIDALAACYGAAVVDAGDDR
jgi:hypothetical protein